MNTNNLQKIIQKTKVAVAGAALGLGLLTSGCSSPTGAYLGGGVGMSAQTTSYKLTEIGNKFQTIPVNPADAGFLHGDTSMNFTTKDLGNSNDLGVDLFARLGWREKYGGLALRAGINASMPFETSESELKQQSSDTRDYNSSSRVYSFYVFETDGMAPYYGLELSSPRIKIDKEAALGISLVYSRRFPGANVRAASGDKRFGMSEDTLRESHNIKGTGDEYTLEINLVPLKNNYSKQSIQDEKMDNYLEKAVSATVGISYFTDKYNSDLAGEPFNVKADGWKIFFRYDF